MNSILTTWSPESLMTASEHNLYDFYTQIAHTKEAELHQTYDYSWITTITSLWPNVIFRLRFPIQKAQHCMQSIQKQVNLGHLPEHLIVSQASPQGDWLTRNGFKVRGQWAGMALDLTTLPRWELSPYAPVRISLVDSPARFYQWVELINISMFGNPSLDNDLMFHMLNQDYARFYLASWAGKPVATSMLFLSSGVASLYMVSTLPGYRRRGIGRIITMMPLRTAKHLGYRFATLQATTMGEGIYRNIGFTEVCKFNIYNLNDGQTQFK